MAERSSEQRALLEPFLDLLTYGSWLPSCWSGIQMPVDSVRSTVTAASVVDVLIALIGIERRLDEGVVDNILILLSQDGENPHLKPAFVGRPCASRFFRRHVST
jgi:hypothetical protein